MKLSRFNKAFDIIDVLIISIFVTVFAWTFGSVHGEHKAIEEGSAKIFSEAQRSLEVNATQYGYIQGIEYMKAVHHLYGNRPFGMTDDGFQKAIDSLDNKFRANVGLSPK